MAKKIKERSKNSKLFNVLGVCLVFFYIALVFIPALWGIMQAFKSRFNWMYDRIGFPNAPTLKNLELFFNYFFITVIKNGIPEKVYFEKMVLNTILFAGGVSVASFIVKFTVAYGLYKYSHFKASGIIFSVILIFMNISLQGSLASALKLYHQLGLYDNMVGFWFLQAHPLGFFFLVLHSSFYAIPKATFEAAEIDGANRWQLMFKIGLPLIKGTVVLFFLTEFINAWNNYMDVLLYLPSYPTVGYGLYMFNLASNPPEISHSTVKLMGALICALPMLIVLIVFGNKLMQNVSISEGVKE